MPDETPPVFHINRAIVFLRMAREDLKSARAPRAANAVRKALKSAEGARRHARNAEVDYIIALQRRQEQFPLRKDFP